MARDSSQTQTKNYSARSVLLVGLGGLGCPAAIALARAGVGNLHLCDDDIVSDSNLHRQVLYEPRHVGLDKLEVAREQLLGLGAQSVTLHRTRLVPEVARELVGQVDVVVEGADNFATKFLTADACYLERVPVVHGAAVRFVGTALSIKAAGAPCYRCIFEDLLPPELAPNCASAGVMGPVVGVVGALMADLALDLLGGDESRVGHIFSYDGKTGGLRPAPMPARATCPLCGKNSAQPIERLSRELYGAAPVGSHSSKGPFRPACI